jgi:HEAT repeat protein
MMAKKDVDRRPLRLFEAKRHRDVSFLLRGLRDPDYRFLAARLLGELRAAEAVPRLIPLLGAGDIETRSSAARALAEIGATEAVPSLIERVRVEREVAPRTWAVSALGDIGDARALDPLCELLSDDSVLVRQSAASALGKLGHPGGLQPLEAAVAQERWYHRKRHKRAIRELRRVATSP